MVAQSIMLPFLSMKSGVITIAFVIFSLSRVSFGEDDVVVHLHRCPYSQNLPPRVQVPVKWRVKGSLLTNLTLSFYDSSPDPTEFCSGGTKESISLGVPNNIILDTDAAGNTTSGEEGNSMPVKVRFLDDGTLLVGNVYYHTHQYCISELSDSALSLTHCKITCAPKGPDLCVHKCCSLGKLFQISKKGLACAPLPNGTIWRPKIYPSSRQDATPLVLMKNEAQYIRTLVDGNDLTIAITYRRIHEDYEISNGIKFRLLRNGNLLQEAGDGEGATVMHRRYCIDALSTEEEPFSGAEEDQIILIPPEDEEGKGTGNATNFYIKIVGVMVAIAFLSLTLVVYLLIWDKHNIHGWAIFSFVTSMLVFCVTLAVVQITHLNSDERLLETRTCMVLAVLIHFSFLCTVSWMTVINFDFWATFRNMSPTPQERNRSCHRYLGYLAFALGIPTLIVGLSLILHYSVPYRDDHNGTLPGYAKINSCNLHPCSTKYYLYTPMTILLAFNVLFFSWTVFTLWTYKMKTQNASSSAANSSSSSGGQKQSWILFCKLFLVMGITWVLEALGGFLDLDFPLFDIICLFQAIPVFFIFAAKRENLLWISRKYPPTKRFIAPILKLKPCYAEMADVGGGEQTEMTSAERNRTLVTFKARSLSSDSGNNNNGGGRGSI